MCYSCRRGSYYSGGRINQEDTLTEVVRYGVFSASMEKYGAFVGKVYKKYGVFSTSMELYGEVWRSMHMEKCGVF